MVILFLHGLASSGRYKMADMLRQLLRPAEVISPDLPIDPDAALSLTRDLIRRHQPDAMIGLSLGGFLALQLQDVPRIAVNPDLHPSVLLRQHIGRMEYRSPREDGALHFTIDEALCQHYEQLENQPVTGRFLGLFAQEDDLVHCGPEFTAHYPGHAKTYPGGHLPTYPDMKFHIVPRIREFLEKGS